MKNLLLGVTLVAISACTTTQDVTKVEVTDEAFFQGCLNEEGSDLKSCKSKLIKRRIGYQCDVSREKSTYSRIKKKSCTTAADRERIARNSDLFIKDIVRGLRAEQTPPENSF